MTWFKGNVHTHTARSDGDIDLDGVVFWYASRGYDWIAITDHNRGLSEDRADRLSQKHRILVIPGNELSGIGHVVGLGITQDFNPVKLHRSKLKNALQAAVNWIRDQDGVPILAHPNWFHRFVARAAGFDHRGPAQHKGHAMSALVDVAFATFEFAAAVMFILLEPLGVASLRAVITGEKHERVLRQTLGVERR